MIDPPLYIASEIYRHSRYGLHHPLSIPRVSTATDLARCLGWLPESQYRTGPMATPEALARFHDPDYVTALQKAETSGLNAQEMDRWNIGRNGNPIYPEVFRRPATAAGSSIMAARMLHEGGIIFSPAGGTHHGQRDRASGFCYLNDPVLAILTFLDQGIAPVVYIDLDVHHGDAVEDAFRHDMRVTTISIHEAGRWPHVTGNDMPEGQGILNLAMPSCLNDDEFIYALETAILPSALAQEPAVIVLQCGVDALADDPLSKQELSNGAIWRAVDAIRSLAPRLLVLGGGGYNPYSVARAWAGIWGRLNDREIPDRLPNEAIKLLHAIPWTHRRAKNPPDRWFEELQDPFNAGPIRQEVRTVIRHALAGQDVTW